MKKSAIFAIFIFIMLLFGSEFLAIAQVDSEEIINTKAIKRFYYEFLNQGKIDIANDIIHKDCLSYSNGAPWEKNGLAGFKEIVKTNHWVNYTGWTFTMEDLVARKNKVVVRYRFKGTHKKSGKKFSGEGIAIYKFADGKMKENRYTWDTWKYHQQLGYTANSPNWAGKEMKK